MSHFFVRDGAARIGVPDSTIDHDAERQLPHKLLDGAVIRLLFQESSNLFLCCCHK